MVESKQQWKAWLYLSPAIILLLIFTVWPIFNTVRMALLEDYSGLEAVGGRTFEFGIGNFTKVIKYIDIYEYKEGKAGVRLTTEPTATFVWNEELHLFTTNVAGEDRYLGTYNTFNTISASATSYITGDNASKIGVSQFPAQLVTLSVY